MSSLLPPPSLFNMEKTPSSDLTKKSPLGFPNEFPYEFDSPAFSPGFSSPGDSTETEDESSDDEEDFLAGLTRRLPPKAEVKTAKEPTLSGPKSFTKTKTENPTFPPRPAHATSFRRDNVFDVISAAADEVARLKLGYYEAQLRRQNAAFETELYLQKQQLLLDQLWLCSQPRINPPQKRVLSSNCERVTFDNPIYTRENAIFNATWLPQHVITPPKRQSVGTGVFLPRPYPTTTTTPLRKVNPPKNLNYEFANVGTRRSQYDQERMLARSALLARQGSLRTAVGGVSCLNQERRLPQDWMY